MEIIGIVLAVLGLGGTVFFGLRSKAVTDAFARYVKLEGEIQHLQSESADNVEKIKELET